MTFEEGMKQSIEARELIQIMKIYEELGLKKKYELG